METKTLLSEPNEIENEIKPCMACMAPMDENEMVCPDCGTVYGSTNLLMPTGALQAEGVMWQKVAGVDAAGRQKATGVRLAGVWLIMFPVLLGALAIAITQAIDRNGFGSFVFFWIGAALAYFSATVLFRVTRDFLSTDTDREVRAESA